MAEAKFYTYVHRTADTGSVFYVGKGKGQRAYTKFNRTKFWTHVANKHGVIVEIVATWETEAEALADEIRLIAELRALGVRLVNLTAGGEGASGQVFTEETKRKISAALTGRQIPAEVRVKISDALKGRKQPERSAEHRAKLGLAMRGRVFSDEHRQKISAANKGRACTDETRRKLSETSTGRLHSDETRKKLSTINMGNQHSLGVKRSDETKQKMSESQKGRAVSDAARTNMRIGALTRPAISEETRLKMSAAHKAAWIARKAARAAHI